MTSCHNLRADLAAYVYGDLAAADTRALESHLEGCAGCREELRGLQRTAASLGSDLLFPREAEVDWAAFTSRTLRRAAQARSTGARAASGFADWWKQVLRAPGWAAAAAAALLVAGVAVGTWGALTLTGTPEKTVPAPQARLEPPEGGEVILPAAMLADIQATTAKAGTQRYLAESRTLLTSLLAIPVKCGDEGVDIAAEREKSLQLLRRQRLIADQLESLPLSRAREVCADLEEFFVEILSLSDCARAEQILELRRHAESRQLMLRLKLLSDEMERRQTQDV